MYITCIFSIFILVQAVESARILGVFFVPSYSHYILGETVLKELALQGHDVTVINPYPQKEKIENYTDIPLVELNEFVEANSASTIKKFRQQYAIETMLEWFIIGNTLTEMSLKCEGVQNLINSDQTFDLIIIEEFLNEAHFGFMHRFKAPVIVMASFGSSSLSNELMGNPTPLAYVPNLLLDYSPKMNLWQRTYSTLLSSFSMIYYYNIHLPEQDRILHENFPDAPPVYDLMHNASLMFLNSHPTSSAAVPLQPNMIEIGGFHVKKGKPLSADLQKFLDDAPEGVVYFSLGSNMKSTYMPEEKVKGIFKAFSKLKMKVLWKWEDDDLPGKPDNVRIEKWVPQPAVLDHENVKVFITHGGRLSTIEAIHYGKPMLGIPIFADQKYNVMEAAYLGYGIYLSYDDLNEENLSRLLKEIIENPRYAEEAKYRSQVLHDLPTPQLNTTLNWIDYILKHRGAPHLRNASLNLRWYQFFLLDIVLLCFGSLWILKKVVWALFSKMFNAKKQKVKTT